MGSFRAGDIAYIIESDRIIREGKILRCTGGLYLLRFTEGGGISVKEHRLYHKEEDAQAEIDRIRKERNPMRHFGDVRLSVR